MRKNIYDRINVPAFKIEGDKGRYICSCCGKLTTLADSVSSQGYNLVCNRCRYIMKRVLGIEDEIIKIQAVGNANRIKTGIESEDNDEYSI